MVSPKLKTKYLFPSIAPHSCFPPLSSNDMKSLMYLGTGGVIPLENVMVSKGFKYLSRLSETFRLSTKKLTSSLSVKPATFRYSLQLNNLLTQYGVMSLYSSGLMSSFIISNHFLTRFKCNVSTFWFFIYLLFLRYCAIHKCRTLRLRGVLWFLEQPYIARC